MTLSRNLLGAVACAICLGLASGSVLAQEAELTSGLEPCIAPHFEPARYVAELEAAGWVALAEDGREPALAALAEGFMPLLSPDWVADPAAARAQQRVDWATRTTGRAVMQRGDLVLHIGGDRHEDGRTRVLCWVSAPQGNATMAELWQIWTNAGRTDQDGPVTRAAIPETPIEGGATFAVFAVSVDPAVVTPPLAAGQGMLTQLIQPVGATN